MGRSYPRIMVVRGWPHSSRNGHYHVILNDKCAAGDIRWVIITTSQLFISKPLHAELPRDGTTADEVGVIAG